MGNCLWIKRNCCETCKSKGYYNCNIHYVPDISNQSEVKSQPQIPNNKKVKQKLKTEEQSIEQIKWNGNKIQKGLVQANITEQNLTAQIKQQPINKNKKILGPIKQIKKEEKKVKELKQKSSKNADPDKLKPNDKVYRKYQKEIKALPQIKHLVQEYINPYQEQAEKDQDLPENLKQKQKLQEIMKEVPCGSKKNIEDKKDYPYNLIGLVVSKVKGISKKVSGTGCIIGQQLILTCAHNRFNSKNQSCIKGFYEQSQFRIGFKKLSGRVSYSKTYKVRQTYIPEQFKNQNSLKDYAFLLLDTDDNLESLYGSLRFDFRQLTNNQEDHFIIGFPQDQNKIENFVQHSGKIMIINQEKILHKMPTNVGVSGSPILRFQRNEEYTIIGIHIQKSKLDIGKGVKFTKKIFEDLTMWLTEKTGHLSLKKKQIGSMGCRIIQQKIKNNLIKLNLSQNCLDSPACEILSEASWENLTSVNLNSNNIGHDGCKWLRQAKWTAIEELMLSGNNVRKEGCQQLIEMNLPNITLLDLSENSIGNEGCRYLKMSKWKHLQTIRLFWNMIQASGCEYLTQAQWPELQTIDLNKNQIDQVCCSHLIGAKWSHLKKICLDQNFVGDSGFQKLLEAEWPQLQQLHLWKNSIKQLNINLISKALEDRWIKLKKLNLSWNNFEVNTAVQKIFKKHAHVQVILR